MNVATPSPAGRSVPPTRSSDRSVLSSAASSAADPSLPPVMRYSLTSWCWLPAVRRSNAVGAALSLSGKPLKETSFNRHVVSLHAALAESELVKDMLCLFGLGILVPSPVSRGADGVGQDEAVDRGRGYRRHRILDRRRPGAPA